jgi:hypothetical protein
VFGPVVLPLNPSLFTQQALPSLAEVMYSQFKAKKESLTKANKEDVIAKYGNEGEGLPLGTQRRLLPVAAYLPCPACFFVANLLQSDVLCCPALRLLLGCVCSCAAA